MSARARLLFVAGLALAASTFGMPGFSGATYTTTTKNTGTITAASDWTPPTVAVTSPGATISGTTTVTVTASDTSGIAGVQLQYAASGSSTWTDLCSTLSTAPYTCAWNTSTLVDGSYQLRATATDNAGYSATSAAVTTSVVNTATVTMGDPGDNLRGTVPLTATLSGIGSATITAFRIEYAVADSTSYSTVCSTTTATTLSGCSWAPGTGLYDLRAYAVVAGKTYTDLIAGVTVDNTAPTGTITSPAKNGSLSGTVTLTTSAADNDSGVAGVVVQYAPTGTTGWLTACTINAAPWSCRFNTTTVADRVYDFRVTITDNAGNTSTPASITGVTIANVLPTVSVEAPTAGSYVSGAVTLSANAFSTFGVKNVVFQVRTGSASFAPVCTVAASPYTCTWNTTGLSGSYDIQAVVTDNATSVRTATSTTVTVTVDNSALKAYDVQTVNSGTAGRMTGGDKLVLTYSNQVNLSTILTGWTGAATTVQARAADGATADALSVDGTSLGSVAINGGYVRKNKTVLFTGSTMVASTTTVNGVTATVVTITLGTPNTGGVSTVSTPGALTWTPTAAVKSLAGIACSLAPATESGTADVDF